MPGGFRDKHDTIPVDELTVPTTGTAGLQRPSKRLTDVSNFASSVCLAMAMAMVELFQSIRIS